MVAFASPVVLVPAFVLLAAFLLGWRHRFGGLPPARAAVVVAIVALWTVYSVASIPELLRAPVESVAVVGGALVLLAVGQRVLGRVRA